MDELEENLDLQYSDDDSVAPATHNKLLGAVSQLYEKKRVKASTRKEPSLEVSEFHLSQPSKKRSNQVKVTELAKVLKKRAIHTEIGQKLKSAQKRAKTLPKPLEKIHADKISRAAGYEHAKQQLNRWDAVVYKQRVAEQVSFPLKADTVRDQLPSSDISTMFRIPTELELKLSELLKEPNPLEEEEEGLKEDKNGAREEDYPLSLAEVVEKRKMMAKLRAQQSYKQAKAVRHSKIKSKKFHQIQRRARVKEQLKEFEELQKKDPEAALKKLEELERTRAEERVTLRHRSTGQWARNLQVRAKYDKEARIALAEQLSKSKELTVKLAQNKESESEKEEEEEVQPEEPAEVDPNNPWVVKRSKEMEEFVSGYRKYWETKGKKTEEEQRSDDTAVKISQVVDYSEKTTDKESLDKENNQPSPDIGVNKTINNVKSSLNSTTVNAKLDSLIKSPGRNVFTVNNIDKCKMMNEKNENTSTKSQDCKINSEDPKISRKSGSWSVTKVLGEKSASDKRKRKGEKSETDFNSKKTFHLNNSYEVTESKHTPDLGDSRNQTKTAIAEERKEEKSLDELFKGIEDKIFTGMEKRLNKLKQLVAKGSQNEVENYKETDSENIPSLELKRDKTFADVDEELLEQSGKQGNDRTKDDVGKNLAIDLADVKQSDNIDPNKFLKVKPRHLSSELPDMMTEGDDALDDEETSTKDRHLTISEAFAEDDVVDQFQKEKEEEVKKSEVGDLDLTLPGWGSWAGHNMKQVARRKRKKFVIKFPKAIPRRDTNRGNVIINEDADKPLKQHQVSEIPFPFSSVKEYEASIRAPMGSTWVPQTAHRKLTLPPVVTQLGAVIPPMDESQLVNKDKQLASKNIRKNNKHKKKLNKK